MLVCNLSADEVLQVRRVRQRARFALATSILRLQSVATQIEQRYYAQRLEECDLTRRETIQRLRAVRCLGVAPILVGRHAQRVEQSCQEAKVQDHRLR